VSADDFAGLLRACFVDLSSQSSFREVHLLRNESLYTCGEQDPYIYLIETGQIKTLMLSLGGKECLLGIYTRMDVIGESCLIDAAREDTATAMVPTIVRRVSRSAFLEILTDNGLIEPFLRYLSRRLSEQQQMITHLVTEDSEQRLAVTLLRLGRKLSAPSEERRLTIEQSITHEELAEMVGTTRTRIGHFLKGFRHKGLIAVARRPPLVIDEKRMIEYVEARSASSSQPQRVPAVA
jgi:CRP/FNR family cyclic AMP-dependent transcriptional regulator